MPLVSWRRSAAVTATSWTTWRRRCSSASQNTSGRFCWRRRCSVGCPGSCATRASRVANVPASIALVRADIARRRGDAARMDVFTQQARAHLTEDDQALRPHVGWYLAVAGWLRGQVAEAEDSLVEFTAEQQAAGERYLAVRPACDLGQVRQARAHLDGALQAYHQALEIATEAGRPLPPAGMALLSMAEVLYERDDLDAAARHATEGIALCRQLAYTQPLATGLAALAWIREAQGDRENALEAMAEAEQVAPGPGPGWRA